jgi:peptidoglycan/LPS O-acetylase OafA/YrhL
MLNNLTESEYVARVLALYVSLPQTPSRTHRTDRHLAAQWYTHTLAWEVIEGAMLLAVARRCLRDPQMPPLQPIRSLHYFVPVLAEVQATPLAPDYVQYLRGKLAPFLAQT